jgi:predicted Mrr-cat superfamily restriction endonuclease
MTMTRYWVISPHNSSNHKLWERVWADDLANGYISVGWREMGDARNLSQAELREKVKAIYRHTHSAGRLWSFLNEIQLGDLIIARRGLSTIAAVGTVTGTPEYDPERAEALAGPTLHHPNYIGVRWHSSPRNKVVPGLVRSRVSVQKITEERFRELMTEVLAG